MDYELAVALDRAMPGTPFEGVSCERFRRLTLRPATEGGQRDSFHHPSNHWRIFSRNFLADMPVARLKATQKLLMLW